MAAPIAAASGPKAICFVCAVALGRFAKSKLGGG
jgi:hypothetical protein